VRRDARARQPPGAEAHEPREVVRGAQVDEPAVDLRLAVEHRPHRLAAECGGDLAVERAPRAAERSEPRDLERAVGGRESRRCLSERSVLHDEASGEDCGERGRAGDDAHGHEHETLAAGAEPRAGEPEREQDAPQRDHAAAPFRRDR
jgi:hypothetical protein